MLGDTNCLCEGEVDDCEVLRYAVQPPSSRTAPWSRPADSLFIAPAALPMREVISASMDPSAEMIEPRYLNEGTNSTSSPSMFIGVVIAEEGEIIMALVFF